MSKQANAHPVPSPAELPCLHLLLPATSPHLCPSSRSQHSSLPLPRPRSSPAAIRDNPPHHHYHHRDLRSQRGGLDLELPEQPRAYVRIAQAQAQAQAQATDATTSRIIIHHPPSTLHSRCHISQANHISFSVRSPCRIERKPIAAEVYHQRREIGLKHPRGLASRKRGRRLNTSPTTTIPASQPC